MNCGNNYKIFNIIFKIINQFMRYIGKFCDNYGRRK